MQRAHEAEIGAIGLDGQMIDAPMIKQVIVICRFGTSNTQTDEFQAQKIINLAKAAGLEIPSLV
jgi:hypothetical protein